jgi:hypothetical protein
MIKARSHTAITVTVIGPSILHSKLEYGGRDGCSGTQAILSSRHQLCSQ